MREDNEPSNAERPNDGEKEVIETDKVFVIDVDFQIVMKNIPDFRFEIPSLREIVKH